MARHQQINFSDPMTWVYAVVVVLLLRKLGPSLISLLGKLTGITAVQGGLLAKQQQDVMQVAIDQNPQQFKLTSGQTVTAARVQDDARKLRGALFYMGGILTHEPIVWETLAEYTKPVFGMCAEAYASQNSGASLVADIQSRMSPDEYANLVKFWL